MSKAEDQFDAFFKAQEMDCLARYLGRGRALEKLTDEELRSVLRDALLAMLRTKMKESAKVEAYEDALAELQLRELPYPDRDEEVNVAFESIRGIINDMNENLTADERREWDRSITEDMRQTFGKNKTLN